MILPLLQALLFAFSLVHELCASNSRYIKSIATLLHVTPFTLVGRERRFGWQCWVHFQDETLSSESGKCFHNKWRHIAECHNIEDVGLFVDSARTGIIWKESSWVVSLCVFGYILVIRETVNCYTHE